MRFKEVLQKQFSNTIFDALHWKPVYKYIGMTGALLLYFIGLPLFSGNLSSFGIIQEPDTLLFFLSSIGVLITLMYLVTYFGGEWYPKRTRDVIFPGAFRRN